MHGQQGTKHSHLCQQLNKINGNPQNEARQTRDSSIPKKSDAYHVDMGWVVSHQPEMLNQQGEYTNMLCNFISSEWRLLRPNNVTYLSHTMLDNKRRFLAYPDLVMPSIQSTISKTTKHSQTETGLQWADCGTKPGDVTIFAVLIASEPSRGIWLHSLVLCGDGRWR